MLERFISKHEEIMKHHQTQLLRYHSKQIILISLKKNVHESLIKQYIYTETVLLTLTLILFPSKSNEYQSLLFDSKIAMWLSMGFLWMGSLMLRWETLPCSLRKEWQSLKQMSGWEQQILDDNRYTYMKQSEHKTNAHQGVDKKFKKKTKHNNLNTPCNHYSFLLVTHTKQKMTSGNWCIHLDCYLCLFGGNTFWTSTMHHLCKNTDL